MYSSVLETAIWLHDHQQRLVADEEGASTVEMVVMMAASISLSIAVMGKVREGIENLSNDISTALSSMEIITSFEDRDAGEG